MPDSLIDSSVLIDAANGQIEALEFVNEILNGSGGAIHAVSVGEVIVGTRDAKELQRLQKFLRPFAVVYPETTDWRVALDYLSRLHLSHDVDLPDCLIAAAALRMDLAVVTLNVRHFRLFKGLKVIRPY